MTTINTIEDLIRLLDENPEWAEALRSRLLTRELIELPRIFAEFAEFVKRQFEANAQQFEAIDRRFEILESQNREQSERLGRVESVVRNMQDDVGILKGAHASNSVIKLSSLLAMEMGLEEVGKLSSNDLVRLVRSNDTSDLPQNELRSFILADLVIEATDTDGEICYVAVEASFTVDERDTRRAQRNASYLNRFTGERALAAVVGVSLDNRVRDVVDSGEVFWLRMTLDDMQAR